nr:PREDICTED: uncharacterized protein LOC109033562 [Bemisia tabaci]
MAWEKSDFINQFAKFKEDGKKLKEAQREYERTTKRLSRHISKGQEECKKLKVRNEYLQAQINLKKCEINQLHEKIVEHEKDVKALEEEIYDYKKKLIIAEHMVETEKLEHQNAALLF